MILLNKMFGAVFRMGENIIFSGDILKQLKLSTFETVYRQDYIVSVGRSKFAIPG